MYDTLPVVDSFASLKNSKSGSVDKEKSSDILLPLIYNGSYFDNSYKVDKQYSIRDRMQYNFHQNQVDKYKRAMKQRNTNKTQS